MSFESATSPNPLALYKKTSSQTYIEIARSLTNVGVFAGAFTFGTLFNVPTTIGNFDNICNLLSIAFLLFTTSLFIILAIQILLRRDSPLLHPPRRKTQLVVTHIALVSGLQIGGFIVLNIVLINIGQRHVGITGIGLLCLTSVWIVCIWYADKMGHFDNPGTQDTCSGLEKTVRLSDSHVLQGNPPKQQSTMLGDADEEYQDTKDN